MSMIFATRDSRKVTIGPTDRVVSADLLATAITCIADLIGHIDRRVMQHEERITVEVARKVMGLLAGDQT